VDAPKVKGRILVTTKTPPRIAIVGGGPAGLTLARVLQTRKITASVFEQENHSDERPQGGTLGLDPDSGLRAVHLAELDEEFRTVARYQDQGLRLLNSRGETLLDVQQVNAQQDNPEIDRAALRALLLNSLEPGVVRWGYHLLSVSQTKGGYELLFENGQRETCDLVVGADGAWSRVRPLLSAEIPFYTGVTFIEIGLDDVDQSHPALAELVGHGSMFALGDNQGIIAQRNGHAHIRIYLAFRCPEKWEEADGLDVNDPQRSRFWLLEQFANWDERLLALIHECTDRFVIRPLYMLQIGHCWKARHGVTLLGDAAHLMSPFAGAGANLAMQDAAELALALSEEPDLDTAVYRYEQAMFVRAEEAARMSNANLALAISPNGATRLLALIEKMQAMRLGESNITPSP
jgi:2-polyprenyl-6-methoxyphenol hydroxylase-like FAD-dependent oxidoreductase